MQARFKGQTGLGGRGKDQAKTSQNKKTRTTKRTKVASPANRTKPSLSKKANQGRNQKEWSAEKRMAARY
jgi:hypothetical protein